MAGSNRLRGITIPIGADYTELNEAMKEINTRSGSLQHELIEVNRLLRVDPGNVELLAQQQALYSDQLDNSRERLQMLRQAEAELQEQFRRGDASEEQMRSLQREIIRTEQSVQRTEDAMNGLNDSTQETGESANKLGEKFKTGLKAAAAATAAAVGAMAIATVKSMDDMTKVLNQYQAATGTAAEGMGEIEESIKRLYNNNLGESFDDIAQSMALIKQQTNLTGGELEDATKYALLMRDTFDLDVNEGIRGANALIKQFGLDAEQAYNLIAIGAQKGLNQNQDLADQLAEYSVYYSEMGFTADEMFDVMAKGAETGAFQIDYLNDAMKEFGIRTKDASDGTMQAFEALGLDAEELTKSFAAGGETAREAFSEVTKSLLTMEDETEQNALGVALFGTKWEDVGMKGMTALMDVQDSIDTTKDALGEINAIKYDSFGEAIQGIGRQFQTGVLIPIGEMVLPVLNSFAQTMQEALNGLQAMGEHLNVIGPIAAGLTVTVGGLTAVFTAHTVATKAQTLATQAAALAQRLLNTALKDNMIGIIVTLVLGLVTAIGTLWATNEDFRNKVTALWGQLTAYFKGVIQSISDYFSQLVTDIKASWQRMSEDCAAAWNSIKAFFTQTIPEIVTTIIDGFAELPGKMLEIGKNIIAGIGEGIQNAVGGLLDNVAGIGSSIANKFREVLGIHSPSLVFKAMGKNIVEGLQIGIGDNTALVTDEIDRLGAALLQSGDAIATGLINIDEKTGQMSYNAVHTGMMRKLQLYYNDRDSRVAAMTDGTTENIAQIQKEITATQKATDIKIKLYQQEYNAKAALVDREANEQTKALQDRIDAINKAAETEQREEEANTYAEKMAELEEKLKNAETDDDKDDIKKQIQEATRAREKQLLQQARQDEQEALRQRMEDVRAEAESKKAAMQEELEAKQYMLEQQREQEIEHLNAVVALMQAQLDKKKELEELQTEIAKKEKELQTKNVDAETEKQINIDLAGLKDKEKNLVASIANDKKTLEGFTPQIKQISNQYGMEFLTGFTSTESAIYAYVDRMTAYMRAQIAAAAASADGSHAKGLNYVPFDGYRAILHQGEAVLTKAEAKEYRDGRTASASSISVTQHIYSPTPDARVEQRQAAREFKRIGLQMS